MTAFETAMAHAGRTPQARAASGTLNFGMEQAVAGFFALDANEATFWAAVTGAVPEIRGTYIVDGKGRYHLDLASSVVATSTTLTITIRPDAVWFSPGHGTTPVTAQDYAYTYDLITDPRNPVASTTGYDQITSFDIVNAHKIVFHWAHPFADYRDLFGYILPSNYLPTVEQMGDNNGAIFDQVWRDCVCAQTVSGGNVVDGDPVTDGPFYMDSYTQGQGVVLKRTPAGDWYGQTAGLTQINFVRTTPGLTEANGLQSGALDAAFPAPTAGWAALQTDPNFVFDVKDGLVQEHWDFNEANPNLAHPWMRRAIALGMNRPALIKALYTDTNLAPGVKQLNNPVYEIGPNATGVNAYFRVWDYDTTHALAILKSHCTGGPNVPSNNNSKIWQCPDGAAQFDWYSTGDHVRSGQIFQQQLMTIGIKLVLHTVPVDIFGTVLGGAQGGNDTYDIAEYAWTGSADPSWSDAVYECNGAGNYKNYCNLTIDNLVQTANRTLDPPTRTSLYEKVAKIVSNKAYVVPLYGRPVILVHNVAVQGMANSNNPTSAGPTWNAELWHY